MSAVTLRHYACGYCLQFAALAEQGAPWRIRRFPATATLIAHPRAGLALFDAGYSRAAPAMLRRWPATLYGLLLPVRVPPGATVAEQLGADGIAPADVRRIVVSHHHPDHVSGAVDFPGAELLADPAEIATIAGHRGFDAVRHGIVPALTPPPARLTPLLYRPAPPGLAPFPEAADIFGDGSLLVVPLPGHTPGMVVAFARTDPAAEWDGDGAGLVLLGADAAWSERALREDIGPPALLRRLVPGVTEARAGAQRLREWLAAHPRADVVMSHDAR